MAGIVETPTQIVQEVLPNPIYAVLATSDGSFDSSTKNIEINRKVDAIVLSTMCCGSNASISSYSYATAETNCKITYKDNTTETLEIKALDQFTSFGSDSNIKIYTDFKDEISNIEFTVWQTSNTSGRSGSFASGTIVII